MGKPAAFDLSVTSPLNLNVLLEAGLTAGAAAGATELRKHDGKCRELGWVCVPMVVEAYGAWGAEAIESLSCLASRLATSSNKAKAAVLNCLYYYGRLNLNLVKKQMPLQCCLDALPRTRTLFRLGSYIYIIIKNSRLIFQNCLNLYVNC